MNLTPSQVSVFTLSRTRKLHGLVARLHHYASMSIDETIRPYRSEDHYAGKNTNSRSGNNRHRQHERPYNDRDDQRNHTRDAIEQPLSSNIDEFGREIRGARGDISVLSKAQDPRRDTKRDDSPTYHSSRDSPHDTHEREFKDDHHHDRDRHYRGRDYRREEQGHDNFQRPPRDPVSYRNANPPSCFLLLSGIPVSVTEDFVSDSLKPFGPLIDIRRLFSSHGNPTQQLVVEYDSVSSSRDVLQAIQALPNAFTIQSHKPSIQFYHPAKKSNKKERREENLEDEGPKVQMNVLGLPLDFQSRFELEGVICHILGLAHPQHIIKSITFENDSKTSSTIGTILFTDVIHVTELLRRTGGQVVIRGFPLTLLPINIPELPQYPNNAIDSRMAIPFMSENTPPPPEIAYKEPICLPPHYSAPPDHYYVYNPESRTILDITSGLHFDLEIACFVDTNRQPIPFDDPRIYGSLPVEESTSEVPQNPPLEPETELNLQQPVRTGPIEFSLKTQPPPSSKPKSALASAAKSKLASASTLTSNSANADPAAPVAPTRGGRHFVNVPRADRPARAELPPSTPQDPPFTRANICLLCRALFNSLAHIKRHVEQSPQHASKLQEFLRQSVLNIEEGTETEICTRQNPKKRLRDETESEDHGYSPEAQRPTFATEPRERKMMAEMETDTEACTSRPDPPSQVSYQGSNIGMKMMQKIGYAGGKLGRKG